MEPKLRITIEGRPSGEEIITKMAKATKGQPVLLAFSGGKDCVAAWLEIQSKINVVPYVMEMIPDLEFVNETIAYYEKHFKTKILRTMHPSCNRMLKNLVFQSPQTWPICNSASLRVYDYDILRDHICETLSLDPQTTWSASGVRAADSIMRRTAMKRYGAINHNRLMFYPVWDMNKAGLVDCLFRSGIKMPVDYQIFGRSFDGIDFRFIYPIRKYFPKDYEKIRELFPMVEVEFWRHKYGKKSKRS
jgi:hypothetical protein